MAQSTPPPFRDWLARIAQGDDRAFRWLFDYFYGALLRLALFYVRTREGAEEVVLDVFTKLWLRRDRLPEIDNIRAYLTTATKHQSLHFLEKRPAQTLLSFADLDEAEPSSTTTPAPDTDLVDAELQERVRWAVAQLPPRCGLVWELVREQGLTYAQTAEALNISVRTVETQMSIALKRLAEACGI